MNDLNRENADKVLRTLYRLSSNEMEEFLLACKANEIPQEEWDNLFRYLDSRGFLEICGKVGNGDVYVQLSKPGYKFFAEDNLASEYARTYEPPKTPNIYHINGDASNFGNVNQGVTTNSSNHVRNSEPKPEKWIHKFLHDTTTQVISALVAAGIIALITWYLNLK